MVIYGILNGYDDFDNMADFLKQNEYYFKNLLLIEKTPSHTNPRLKSYLPIG